MGGTVEEAENREEARRIVPSPPKVVVKSTFSGHVQEFTADESGEVV